MTEAIAVETVPILRAPELDPELSKEVEISAGYDVQLLETAVESCRQGDWGRGLRHLLRVADSRTCAGQLPSLFYSYLGHAIAAQERRVKEGLRLCRHAIRLEFYQPENYLNLARTCLLAGRRSEASRALTRGLELDAEHPDLLILRAELGNRRRPVLGSLNRGNPINKLLGRLRHGLASEAKN